MVYGSKRDRVFIFKEGMICLGYADHLWNAVIQRSEEFRAGRDRTGLLSFLSRAGKRKIGQCDTAHSGDNRLLFPVSLGLSLDSDVSRWDLPGHTRVLWPLWGSQLSIALPCNLN